MAQHGAIRSVRPGPARAVDKFVKRKRRYVRREVTVTDVESGKLYFTQTRDILSR